MSVINQMLRDLDARGRGDDAARRAAMASVGDASGPRQEAWRTRRPWWLVAGLAVALASTVAMTVADRWRASDAVAAEGPAEAIPPQSPASPPASAASVREPDASAAPPVEQRASARVAAPERAKEAPSLPTPRPVPATPAEPPRAGRASIERVVPEPDPLDAARDALSDGRADDALDALPDLPVDTPERDAIEAAALQSLGRHAEAEEAYRRALRREPDVGAWWAGLGISLDAGGRGDEALAAFREAQRRGPLDPALADYLGERVEALSAGEPSR